MKHIWINPCTLYSQLVWLIVFSSQTLCKELHQKIDVVDEERYDIAVKVSKNEREVTNILQLLKLYNSLILTDPLRSSRDPNVIHLDWE